MYYELKAQRSMRKKVLINITPLIDVLFILIIFFMVTSTFLEQPAIHIQLPNASTAEPTPLSEYILTVGKDSVIYLNNEIISRERLEGVLTRISAEEQDAFIILKADEAVPYGFIIELLDLVKRTGLSKVTVLTHIPERSLSAYNES